MLDHDDLFTDVIKNNQTTTDFLDLIDTLVSFCNSSDFNLLRTRGVISLLHYEDFLLYY